MSDKLKKVYCNHCKKSFKTDSLGAYHMLGFIKFPFDNSCPYCDRIGRVVNIYYIKSGKQKWMYVFYESK